MINHIRREVPNHFRLPRRISRLGELAFNLWWVWNPDGQNLYALIDKDLWDRLHHNPVEFLQKVERPRLNAVTNDRYYLDLYDRVMREFDKYMQAENTWFSQAYSNLAGDGQIAYFSFEFGLAESLPVYAGGLGILSGDHLKESSDLGLPLVGVGFIYNQGYFSQHITEDGWQETRNRMLDFSRMPIIDLYDENGEPLTIEVDLPGRKVYARLYQVQVGRVPLYLLSTNIDQNSQADRELTARLYSNDPETRISQEIVLGIGGVRALRRLGYDPTVWHMNEGHSAFLVLERIREYMKTGMDFPEAADEVKKTNVFTTHTPVPAGNDQFPVWLMDKYFTSFWPELDMTRDQFIDLARHNQPWGEMFSMPVLALRLSDQRNAVSELHGQVSRAMWQFLWPDRSADEVPIDHITNGIHMGTWLARRMAVLFELYLGHDWYLRQDDPDLWAQVENIPDGELWAVRQHLKRKLLSFATERTREEWRQGHVHPVQVVAGGVLLEPYSLTIGFARRFATYKRASLILRDYKRLMRIVTNSKMPVQIIFAGKAHPADEPGKLLIQQVYRAVKDANMAGRLVFLEDYDMNVARHMVQGVDVWLNNPRRPNEASGTSGMKAAVNGVLNFSVLDGWWHEAYNGRNGWSIGSDREYPSNEEQDEADAQEIYDKLENEIIPLYYNRRSSDKLPGEWIGRMKELIRTLAPQFNTMRMVKEYMDEMYLPAMTSDEEETITTVTEEG